MNKSIWAKKTDKHGNLKWLNLEQHCLDTMNIAGLLFEHYIGDGVKEILSNDIGSENKAKQLVKFIGAIHDIGKATPVFQTSEYKVLKMQIGQDIFLSCP